MFKNLSDYVVLTTLEYLPIIDYYSKIALKDKKKNYDH